MAGSSTVREIADHQVRLYFDLVPPVPGTPVENKKRHFKITNNFDVLK
jgi:hypothetical protein